MKTYTLEEVQNKLIGNIGTPDHDKSEYELQMEMIGNAIKQARKDQHLTQEELGKLIGVQNAQISKLERSAVNVTINTLIKVFGALKTKVKLQIELPDNKINIGFGM